MTRNFGPIHSYRAHHDDPWPDGGYHHRHQGPRSRAGQTMAIVSAGLGLLLIVWAIVRGVLAG